MDTNDVLMFTVAASAGSLSAAARRLGMTPMAATRRLAALEATLGVRLMQRTTRSLSLTTEGEAFLPFARAMVENEDEARALLRAESKGAAGLLRVSVPIAFGRKVVAPLIPRLLAENPDLRISCDMSDSLPDLVATGTDLAIRIARLRDSSLVAQKLADNPRCLVAAPSYLAQAGMPRTLADMRNHACLPMTGTTHWNFSGEDGEVHLRLNARFTSSSIEGCHAAALAGAGIALLSLWNADDDITTGRLIRIDLADARPEDIAIQAVYPTSRLVSPRVRLFIAALKAVL